VDCEARDCDHDVLNGWLYGGGASLLGIQLVGVLVAGCWAALWTFLICMLLGGRNGVRMSLEEEEAPDAVKNI